MNDVFLRRRSGHRDMGASSSKTSEAYSQAISAATSTSSGCPVPEELRNSRPVYNVYNQRIDPAACPNLVS
jgi:hypothetical protein